MEVRILSPARRCRPHNDLPDGQFDSSSDRSGPSTAPRLTPVVPNDERLLNQNPIAQSGTLRAVLTTTIVVKPALGSRRVTAASGAGPAVHRNDQIALSRRGVCGLGLDAASGCCVAVAGDGHAFVGRCSTAREASICRKQISTGAIHCDLEGSAHFAHPCLAEPPEAFDDYGDRDALNGVEIDRASSWDWIVLWLQYDLAEQIADRRRARSNEGSAKPWNGSITRQDDNWSTTDVWKLAPPHFPSGWKGRHDAAAESRNEARSPHSSGSSSGCCS